MNPVFTTNPTTMKKFFAPVTGYTGSQAKALSSVSENLISIGTVLNEGQVAGDYASIALAKLHEAKLAIEYAIANGWNGGTSH